MVPRRRARVARPVSASFWSLTTSGPIIQENHERRYSRCDVTAATTGAFPGGNMAASCTISANSMRGAITPAG